MVMNINLNHYSYSYANAIGHTLKQPLFQVITKVASSLNSKPWENRAWRIAKIAFNCLVAAIFIMPAGFAWLAGKAISHFSKTQIDLQSLHLAPEPMQILQEAEVDEAIDIKVLSEKFNQLKIQENVLAGQTSKKDSLLRLCNWTINQDSNIFPDEGNKRSLFCKQLSVLLQVIIKKLESGKIPKEKEEDILKELAEASTRCYPTWLEVAAKLFAEMNGQSETVEVKLLRFIQDYKETLILNFSQKVLNAQWHALNFVRNILGTELGLNTSLNEHDPYAAKNDATFGKNLTKWLFLQQYENANALISAVQTMINLKAYDASYADLLIKITQDLGIPDPADYVAEHFYTEDFKLNELGVNLMLKMIGVLK